MRAKVFWLGLGGLMAGLLVGGGMIYVRTLYGPAGDKTLEKAQKAYDEGAKALEVVYDEKAKPTADESRQAATTAAQKFDEARLLATKAIEELERDDRRRKQETLPAVIELEGKAFRVKAQSLRDKHYADMAAKGEKLPLAIDTSMNEKFRTVLRLADMPTRNEAVVCQREAALRLQKDEAAVQDAIRTEVSFGATANWPLLETLAKAMLDLNPKDARSLYIVARIDVDQPRSDGKGPPVPTDPAKRSRDRLLKARDTLTSAGADKIPPFRKLYLEAQVAQLLRDRYAKEGKTKDTEREDQILQKLVLDPQASALAKAMRDEPKGLGAWDQEAILGLHALALDRALEDMKSSTADAGRALAVLGRLVAHADEVAAKEEGKAALDKAIQAAIEAAGKVQPQFEGRIDGQWKKALDDLQALAGKANAEGKKVATAATFSALSRLLNTEAVVEGKRMNRARAEELQNQAKKWLEEGLKLSADDKANPAARFELLTLAAERAALEGKATEAQGYLAEMRKQTGPNAVATVAILDALLLHREGKLDRCRQELEKVIASPAIGLHLRAHLMLAQLYRTLNQPEKALDSAVYVDNVINKGFEQLNEVERAWAQQFHASPDSARAQLAVAHLGAARAKLARHLQEKPNDPAGALPILSQHEDPVVALIAKLPKKSDLETAVRLDHLALLAQTGRADKARKGLEELAGQNPASTDVLRFDVALRLIPPPGTKPAAKLDPTLRDEIDRRIDTFVAANPTVEAGRLFKAQWLMRTERAAEAVAYLKDKANFPSETATQQQMLGLAHLAAGQRDDSIKVFKDSEVLKNLPPSAGLDALLIRLAESREAKYAALDKALKQHESNGLFRCWEGEKFLAEGKTVEAVERFRAALEVTAIRPLAEQGLRRALFEMCAKDPKSARETAIKLADEMANESLPVLAAAYAALVLGDIGDGSAKDGWPKSRSMHAALAEWEQRQGRLNADKVALTLTRAEFFALANNVAQARVEIERALAQKRDHLGALVRAVNLCLAVPEKANLDRAEQYLKILVKEHPDAPLTLSAVARVADAGGKAAEAIAAYEKAVAKTPTDAAANARLIGLLDANKQLDKVPAVLDAWAKAEPEAIGPRLMRVWYLAKAGQKPAATAAADKLVEDHGKAAEKVQKGTEKQARQAMDQEATRQLLAAGATDLATARVNALLKDDPDLLGAQLLRGDILMKEKKFAEAVAVYEAIRKKHPTNLIAGNNLAYVLAVELDQAEKADAIVRELRRNEHTGLMIGGDRLDPSFLDTVGHVYQRLAKANKLDGPRLEEMRDLFEPAILRYSDDPRLPWHLGFALAGLKDTGRARDLLDRADRMLDRAGSGRLSDDERAVVRQGVKQVRETLKP